MQRPFASPTVRQAAILIADNHTAQGAAATPRSLLPCGDRPFLAWMLRELCRYGVEEVLLLTGDSTRMIEVALPAISASLPRVLRLACVPGDALSRARDRFADRFLLCNGETWLDFNLCRLLSDVARDPDDVLCRMVLRRPDNASPHAIAETEGDRITGFREGTVTGQPGRSGAGVYLLKHAAFEAATTAWPLEHDILPRLAARGALRGTVADGSFIDLGIPADHARAQIELPVRLHRRALFLDRDGVINVDHGWVGTRERFEFMPGALATIRAASDAGWHVFVVTNQSGIARGHFDEAQFAELCAWMIDAIRLEGGTVDDLRYCPTHPDAPLLVYRRTSDWRKPGPGMLLDLLSSWQLDPARCLMIGDQPTDHAAAAAAGVPARLFAGRNLADFVMPLLADAEQG
jgi:D,D-heptose 1,7-bisphosphate phosphatase